MNVDNAAIVTINKVKPPPILCFDKVCPLAVSIGAACAGHFYLFLPGQYQHTNGAFPLMLGNISNEFRRLTWQLGLHFDQPLYQ